jgi:hypothetical protein
MDPAFCLFTIAQHLKAWQSGRNTTYNSEHSHIALKCYEFPDISTCSNKCMGNCGPVTRWLAVSWYVRNTSSLPQRHPVRSLLLISADSQAYWHRLGHEHGRIFRPNLLTRWSRVPLEKPQLVQILNSSLSLGTRMFISVFRNIQH